MSTNTLKKDNSDSSKIVLVKFTCEKPTVGSIVVKFYDFNPEKNVRIYNENAVTGAVHNIVGRYEEVHDGWDYAIVDISINIGNRAADRTCIVNHGKTNHMTENDFTFGHNRHYRGEVRMYGVGDARNVQIWMDNGLGGPIVLVR